MKKNFLTLQALCICTSFLVANLAEATVGNVTPSSAKKSSFFSKGVTAVQTGARNSWRAISNPVPTAKNVRDKIRKPFTSRPEDKRRLQKSIDERNEAMKTGKPRPSRQERQKAAISKMQRGGYNPPISSPSSATGLQNPGSAPGTPGIPSPVSFPPTIPQLSVSPNPAVTTAVPPPKKTPPPRPPSPVIQKQVSSDSGIVGDFESGGGAY